MLVRSWLALVAVSWCVPVDAADPRPEPKVQVLFDFEEEMDLKDWSSLELPDPKKKEPPVKIELSKELATSGKHSLMLTKDAAHEIFMRHRSPLMRMDLSSIPAGSEILAAQLVIVRAAPISKDHNPEEKPTMWVAEPCNRPWEEYEVNAYQYAKDKFWKAIGGQYYGDDPDFLPFYVAYGPGSGKVNVWDFAEAVRFWTGGKHANHGFMLHGDSNDYIKGFAREAKEFKDRPAVLVIYVPK